MDDTLAQLVNRWSSGDAAALGRLTELLYDDLRRLARAHLRRERSGHTLGTTALVHEAYMELARRTGTEFRGRAQFLALVSRIMRHVLVDYARRRSAAKRGGGELIVSLDDGVEGSADSEAFELLSVNQALEQLALVDERLVRLVECRFFGGMSAAEIGEVLQVSSRTVERDWLRARAHLYTLLAGEAAEPAEQ